MKPPQTRPRRDAFPSSALRRAFAGVLAPGVVPLAIQAAFRHSSANRRRVSRMSNPVGHLYRVGRDSTDGVRHPWPTPVTKSVGATIEAEQVAAAFAVLPARQADVVWLVHACGWTNVQTAEALAISPAVVADVRKAAAAALWSTLGLSEAAVATQLGALADTRVDQLDDDISPGTSPPDQEAAAASRTGTATNGSAQRGTGPKSADQNTQRRLSPWWTRSLIAAGVAALAIVGFILSLAAVRSPGPPTTATATATADGNSSLPEQPFQDRERMIVAAWERPVRDNGLAGTFAMVELDADLAAVQVADDSRSRRVITLDTGETTTAIDQLVDASAPRSDGSAADTELVQHGPGWVLTYQTGTGSDGDTAITWTAGVVEVGSRQWAFAHNVDQPSEGGLAVGARLDAVVEFLVLAGVVPDR